MWGWFWRCPKTKLSGEFGPKRHVGGYSPTWNGLKIFSSDNLQIGQNVWKRLFTVAVPHLICWKLCQFCGQSPTMELVLGLNFHRLKPVYAPNSSSRIYQLFGIFKGYAITRIDLKSRKWRKLINTNSLLNPERLIFGRNSTRNYSISRIGFCPCCYRLTRKCGVVSVIVQNPPRNNWSVQLFVDPQYPLVSIGGQYLNKSMIWEACIRALISDLWSLVIINPWVFFDVDNRKVPITVAVFSYKRLPKRWVFRAAFRRRNLSHKIARTLPQPAFCSKIIFPLQD